MKIIEISVEDAIKYANNGKILVATYDLEKDDEVVSFKKTDFLECRDIIQRSETVAKVCDELANQLRCYSHRQKDLFHIENIGKLKTFLL